MIRGFSVYDTEIGTWKSGLAPAQPLRNDKRALNGSQVFRKAHILKR